MHKRITGCRICGKTEFQPVIDLGNQYVVDFVKEKSDDALRAPLTVVRCLGCNLVQLLDSVEPDRMFKKFWYRSGISEAMKEAMKNLAAAGYRAVGLEEGDTVLDIGANDGTLLGFYPDKLVRIGCDPCGELLDEGAAAGRIDISVKAYFSKEAVAMGAPYKIITAAAMFYDLDEPLKFLVDIKKVLHRDGVFIVQMNYLKAMIDNTTFDNISHEHVAYYSFTMMERLVQDAGLEIQGAEVNTVNGGSFRVYVTHPRHTLTAMSTSRQVEIHATAIGLKMAEAKEGYNTDEPYKKFLRRTGEAIAKLKRYIEGCSDVYLCGASTRGATILQALDLPEGFIRGAADRDSKKWGLMTVGTWVPIMSEEAARALAKTYLVLPYHFIETIRRREHLWLAQEGHKMIVPLPDPYVIMEQSEERIGVGLN